MKRHFESVNFISWSYEHGIPDEKNIDFVREQTAPDLPIIGF